MKKVLVLCTGNSCRSQMVHGYLKVFSKGLIEVFSAGVETHGLNPTAVKVMKEDGVDISNHTSNHIDEYHNIHFDLVITVCDHAQERCPFFPNATKILHKSFSDPSNSKGSMDERLKMFRNTRDEIKAFSKQLIQEYITLESEPS